MSDLILQLQQAASQLPVSSYFDEALFQRELQALFQQGPRYLGHQLSVPEVRDYYALPHEGEGRALGRTDAGVELISNICRHRQAIMLKGRSSLKTQAKGSVTCPILPPAKARWNAGFLLRPPSSRRILAASSGH